jgi:hypothetical protein
VEQTTITQVVVVALVLEVLAGQTMLHQAGLLLMAAKV